MTERGGRLRGGYHRSRSLWAGWAAATWLIMPVAGCEGDGAPALGDASTDAAMADEAHVTESGPGPASLFLHGVTPDRGPPEGGTRVTLRGAGFAAGLRVFFGQTEATTVEVLDATSATAIAPPHPPGRVDVMLTVAAIEDGEDGEGARQPDAFEYVGTLRLDRVAPAEVPVAGGTLVTLEGTGFTPDSQVIAGRAGRAATRFVDAGTLLAVVPPDDFGDRDVHVATATEVATAPGALRYREGPRLDALHPEGRVPEGEAWVLHGRGLAVGTLVTVDGLEMTGWKAAGDGRALTFVAPDGLLEAGEQAEIVVANAWGVAARAFPVPRLDEEAGRCRALGEVGDARGGDVVALWCPEAGPEAAFTVGPASARVVARSGAFVALANPGGPEGAVAIAAREDNAIVAEIPWRLALPAGAARLTGLTPTEGAAEGGDRAYLEGGPFAAGAVVTVGAAVAGGVRREADGRLSFDVPAGPPGIADVRVVQAGTVSVLRAAWTWRGLGLSLVVASPSVVAQAGGTRVTLVGSGLGRDTAVRIGGIACPVVEGLGSSVLVVRSPRLDPGAHDVEVRSLSGAIARRVGLLVAHDPRSALGGAWGGPVRGAIDVTVETTEPQRPVDGATVVVTTPTGEMHVGVTDGRGQATLSADGLAGPLDVSVSAPGFTAASFIEVDARHATFVIYPNPPPPAGEGEPPPTPPNAVLSGRVSGIDKFVTAPAGRCEALLAEGVTDCMPCTPQESSDSGACGGEAELACVGREVEGQVAHACLRACAVDAAQGRGCPGGYACGPTEAGERCVPAPGERAAVCNVTTQGGFGYNFPPQPTGWVDDDARYVLDSRRLGDLAVYCFGGYRHDDGSFTPVVLGVRRHISATSGAVLRDLDVALEHPLRRTVRVRIPEPPDAGGLPLAPPVIGLSLDLGADGAIGLSRVPIPDAAPGFWRLPQQLEALAGNLADGRYLVLTTLRPALPPDDPTAPPHPLANARSNSLITAAESLVAERMPVRDGDAWRLDSVRLERDLHGLWRGEDGRLVAVGEAGTVLLRPATGGGWTRQSPATPSTLRAIAGREDALWAVGDGGASVVWDGRGWRAAPGPAGRPNLLGAARLGDRLVAAGEAAVWERPLALTDGDGVEAWRPLAMGLPERIVGLSEATGLAFGAAGAVWRVAQDGLAAIGRTDGWAMLAAAPLGPTLALGVGEGGGLARIDLAAGAVTVLDGACDGVAGAPLTAALAMGPGEVLALGERGLAVTLREVGDGRLSCAVATIAAYRSRPAAAALAADGTVRVVGSAAFDLGPFLAFPEAVAGPVGPLPGALVWTWRGGPPAGYVRHALTPAAGPTAWVLVVEGRESRALLPDLGRLTGSEPLPPGAWRWDLMRVLSPGFDLDDHTTRSYGVMTRDSWSTNQTALELAP